MRFPEFTEEWKEERLSKIAELSKGVGISKEQLSEDGEPCILYGELYTKYKSEIIHKVISKTNIESSNLKRSKRNDVIIPCSGETAIDIAVARCVPFDNIILGGDLNIIRLHKDDGAFMAYQLNGKRKIDIAQLAQGVSVVHLYGENIKAIKTYNPCLQEQQKIVKLLSMLDERIEVQNKIIEKLETLIKGIRDYVLNNKLQNITKKKLGELCTITTGKLDANAMKSEGLYPFFTCAEEVYRIDSFAFDTEALLVSGNGANLGYIHYYKGKFNAYQRTYVLSNFIEDIHYIQIYLEAYLHKRIALEKSTSNTPYIVLATLAEMPIIIPNIKIQKDISNKILILKSKLITEIHIRNCYKDMRQFLLSQMFI
ncbi:restriction endonuclease subunit S [Coprobacter fastidiosus]|uniref:restriction endonuclease subunit S n=1 Tax=Coprobacter fastidiosus TaxID=1099853 RepID=UPI0022E8E756|nr:restriction endonuclease subunit S [Coprobacter fastidiosus]